MIIYKYNLLQTWNQPLSKWTLLHVNFFSWISGQQNWINPNLCLGHTHLIGSCLLPNLLLLLGNLTISTFCSEWKKNLGILLPSSRATALTCWAEFEIWITTESDRLATSGGKKNCCFFWFLPEFQVYPKSSKEGRGFDSNFALFANLGESGLS